MLSRNPQQVPKWKPEIADDAKWWYYEEPEGIEVYSKDGCIGTIPWRLLRASLKRKDGGCVKS